ncbi:MAG: enoyl-CoA hydratase-related protein [Acidobacteria bacterium]|nr:enoyl-CoA hydratase-related protein [Acidobacteriota bacterium]
MEFRNILWEVKDRVGTLTVNRPSVRNALNREAVTEIGTVLELAAADPEVGVLILTGAGEKAFVAGADIGELAQQAPIEGRDYALRGQAIFSRLESLGKPTLAAVNGYALGGGCELAMACTLRIASATAKFGQPEVNLGIIPGYGGTQRLSRLVGMGRAMELILTGRILDAEEAERIGLVNQVTPPEELIPTTRKIAATLVSKGPLALRFAAEAIQRGMDMSLEEGLHLEATLFGLCCASEDMKEGTLAFMEKRNAKFRGR